MSFNINEVDLCELFERVVSTNSPMPNSFPLQFEGINIKEKFEFLLEFVTKLCKYFYGNSMGQVNLDEMTPQQFNIIDSYVNSIGYSCKFESKNANTENLNYMYDNRYDRIEITLNTILSDLKFGLKCNNILYVISFSSLYDTNQMKRRNNTHDDDKMIIDENEENGDDDEDESRYNKKKPKI
jgi:hypothetical protein